MEDKVIKGQQQGLSITNLYSVDSDKPFIPGKYKNWM